MKNDSIGYKSNETEVTSYQQAAISGQFQETNDSLWREDLPDKKVAVNPPTASVLRHDLNNAICAMVVNLHILEMQVLDPEQKNRLATIETLAFKISSIIESWGVSRIGWF